MQALDLKVKALVFTIARAISKILTQVPPSTREGTATVETVTDTPDISLSKPWDPCLGCPLRPPDVITQQGHPKLQIYILQYKFLFFNLREMREATDMPRQRGAIRLRFGHKRPKFICSINHGNIGQCSDSMAIAQVRFYITSKE